MPEYLVERYASRLRDAEISSDDLQRWAQRVTEEGTPVHYVRSIFVPGDEICMWLFRGPSGDAVRRLMELAGVPYERIVEAEPVRHRRSPSRKRPPTGGRNDSNPLGDSR
jgi:hypothetical protein